MIAESKFNRCWFRFSLRTLFALVTVVAVGMGYVGWQARIVEHRRSMAREIINKGGQVWMGLSDLEVALLYGASKTSEGQGKSTAFETWPDSPIPWARRQLGDVPVFVVFVPRADVAAVKEVFPEAVVLPSYETATLGPFDLRPLEPFEDLRPESWKKTCEDRN